MTVHNQGQIAASFQYGRCFSVWSADDSTSERLASGYEHTTMFIHHLAANRQMT